MTRRTCEALLVSRGREVATGRFTVKRQGKGEGGEVFFGGEVPGSPALTAAQQHSLSSAVKVWEIQTEEDSHPSAPQAKTTSESRSVSPASSVDGNDF